MARLIISDSAVAVDSGSDRQTKSPSTNVKAESHDEGLTKPASSKRKPYQSEEYQVHAEGEAQSAGRRMTPDG